MLRTVTATKWIVVFFVVSVTFSSASAFNFPVQKHVEVKNSWTHNMWATFKCYHSYVGELDNGCPSETATYSISPGQSRSWSYWYKEGMGCRKIYMRYGRMDRSCEYCHKIIDATFDESENKVFNIIPQGSGDLGFGIEVIHGQ